MHYEVSEKIRTQRSQAEILQVLEKQFRNVSSNVQRSGQGLVVKKVAKTFGSINREDTTNLSVRQIEDGWLIVAGVDYNPSAVMFVLVIVTFCTAVGWAIPILFFVMQREMVKSAVQTCLHNVKNELDQPVPAGAGVATSYAQELEQLGDLKERGLISESEFEEKRKRLLGL